jgi:hypothetical protein
MKYLFVMLFLSGCGVTSLVSGGVYAVTDKTPTDHILSYNTGMDCQTVRIFENDSVCKPYKVKYVERKK